ncbi:MAG TPA: carboxypeptidase-like regulatory domain-containing protein [Bryobacteraceae bacterium]|nr:carboxypeptidase-like regulatory domain-containing protein [Bryobacteraceae bacterium]
MKKKTIIWGAAILGLAILVTLLVRYRLHASTSIEGAVILQDSDPRKQLPIPGVEVTAILGNTTVQSRSDASGFFRMTVRGAYWLRQRASLTFQRQGYEPVRISQPLTEQIYVVRMTALKPAAQPFTEEAVLKDVRVRYAAKTSTPVDVGSSAQAFEVKNTGGVPCNGAEPCSPDGKWKASIDGLTLDAGEGHEFRNVSASCIAGPCPFTKIESDQFSRGGRNIKVSVRNWSDTVTFLVDAEVVQTLPTDLIREAYPIIFGREMSFTIPPTGEGPSIEADLNGTEIVFPLGPTLALSWAQCNLQVSSDRAKLYRCELKPGYRFQ